MTEQLEHLEHLEYFQRGSISKNKGRGYIKLKNPVRKEFTDTVIEKIIEIVNVKKEDITIRPDMILIEPLVGKITKNQIEKISKNLREIIEIIDRLTEE